MNKNVGGRPKKYNSRADLVKAINEYFDRCNRDNDPYTMTGLGLSIGLSRGQMLNYAKDERFHYAIGAAKLIIIEYLEKRALTADNSAGPIFMLKNLYPKIRSNTN